MIQQRGFYMNEQFYPAQDKRSHSMETASLVLGIIAISTCSCFYSSIVCGALAIIFALLSRGGENTMSGKAKIGLGLGIAGLVATILLYAAAYMITYNYYGGLEGLLRAYCDMYGLDYQEMYGDYAPLLQ
jgi:predicted histidine transporter YuiF (NhaC family)